MKILDIRNNFSPELASKEAALALLKGRTVVYPTDTLYGLVGRAQDRETVERVYRIKGRQPNKPLIVLISSLNDLLKFKVKAEFVQPPEFR